ncbi:phosphosugar isomerase [Lachnoclostridium sp. An14]|uniref:SIS domain-containing protein n=1 Tax=Lachnoclostridium sp. An14 TaxID=1965562 RepID=UPI000B3920E0|nr:SIS domain-containing protein [Lachnoclostridium sp. An14]OUQ16668.1 phosphosugar isomerase [Lachnoclostridium sp. An14]
MYNIDLSVPKQIVADILSKKTVENVVFVGCGASKSELYPAKYFLANASKKLRVAHYTANEFNYDTPDWLGETTVVITASLGGSTPETVKANSVAKAAGATVVSVTHAAGSALTKEADYSIVHGFEANYAAKLEKMGYVMALALEILQQTEGYEKYDKMVEGFENIFELAETSAQAARKAAKEFAEAYKDAPVVYVMSSGASAEVAYSTSICLMMEMQWINSGSFHAGEFFHGPFEIVDKNVPFILLMNDGKTRAIDSRALTFLERFDALTTVVDAKDYGLTSAVSSDVATYFNPLLHTAVFRVFAEELSYIRQHPLTKRRYMWKLEY